MTPRAFLLSCVLCILPATQDELDSQVRTVLADPVANKALIESISKRPIAEIEKAIRGSRRYESKPAGLVKDKAKNAFEAGVTVEYQLWVPEHDAAKRYPLLVSLHGQHGTADGAMRLWLEEVKKEEGLFLLAPDAAKGGWGRSRVGFASVQAVIRDAIEKWPIDPLRVYVDGASMGGNGSFQFAYMFPDLVAAAAPRAGGPEFFKDEKDPKLARPRFLQNLRNTPVYWIVGVKDEKVPIDWVRAAKAKADELKLDLVYREMEGGHEWFPQESPKVLEWLRGRTRDPYPKRVEWMTHERIWNRVAWIEITGFSKEAQEVWKRTYVDLENKPLEERLHFVHPVEIKAEVDREKNVIRVTSKFVTELRVYVSDAMLDLDKEISVTVNGTTTKKKVTRSASVLLESAVRSREQLFAATIDVKVSK